MLSAPGVAVGGATRTASWRGGGIRSHPGLATLLVVLFLTFLDYTIIRVTLAAVQSSLALAMGPVIGAVLVGVYSWRAVFWFNPFFGLVALIGAAAVLPETSDRDGAHLDLPGSCSGRGRCVRSPAPRFPGSRRAT